MVWGGWGRGGVTLSQSHKAADWLLYSDRFITSQRAWGRRSIHGACGSSFRSPTVALVRRPAFRWQAAGSDRSAGYRPASSHFNLGRATLPRRPQGLASTRASTLSTELYDEERTSPLGSIAEETNMVSSAPHLSIFPLAIMKDTHAFF